MRKLKLSVETGQVQKSEFFRVPTQHGGIDEHKMMIDRPPLPPSTNLARPSSKAALETKPRIDQLHLSAPLVGSRLLCHAHPNFLLSLLAALLVVTNTSNAGPWEDGYAAYQRKDYVTAVAKWHIVADSGDAKAQSLLGIMHFFGQGVPQNYPQAIKWLHLAAAQGESKAQFKLGSMHANGQGFKRDNVRAAMWFVLAAESGHPDAQKALNKISVELSPAQIAVANRLAQTCINREYKDCN